jgi:hypothetical protein
MLGHYTKHAYFTPSSQAFMASTLISQNAVGVLASGMMLFVWFHKNLSFHPKRDMMIP